MPAVDLMTNNFSDEAQRVAALHALALLDSEPEREFDALVALAAEMLGCPNALLTLVDSERLWIKAASDGERGEISREVGMCSYTIQSQSPLVIEDLAGDIRFAANPFTQRPDGIRFYAGAPVHAKDEHGEQYAIGSICVVDTVPRSLNDAGRKALTHLATLAEAMIAARSAIAWRAADRDCHYRRSPGGGTRPAGPCVPAGGANGGDRIVAGHVS
jgi:GAF domain-containing protein